MSSLITILCILGIIVPPSILNIILYPISLRLTRKVSHYIQKSCGPRLFGIFKYYRHFYFWDYPDLKDELPEQFLIISNHQSLLDIPVYMRFLRDRELRFVAKDSLARHVPLVSEMLRSEEHCCIPRKAKPMEAMKYVENFGKRARERGQTPVLFPEGTRTRDGSIGKFYSAGFRKLSESCDLPIVVCALDGGYVLRDLKKMLTNMHNGCYRVKALKVYEPPKTKDECQALLDEARDLIEKQVEEWRKLPSNVK